MVLSCCQVTIDALRCCINIVQTVGSLIKLCLKAIHSFLLSRKLSRDTCLPGGSFCISCNTGWVVGICIRHGPRYALRFVLQGNQFGLCLIQLSAQLADTPGDR